MTDNKEDLETLKSIVSDPIPLCLNYLSLDKDLDGLRVEYTEMLNDELGERSAGFTYHERVNRMMFILNNLQCRRNSLNIKDEKTL